MNFKYTILLLTLALSFQIQAQQTYRKINNDNENKRRFTFEYEIIGISPGKIARFQQRIPSDFQAFIENPDVHVLETPNLITFIWQSLPKDTVLRFSFDITAPPDVQGTFHIGDAAFMSFDKHNQILKVSYKPCPILINESPFSVSHSNAIVKNIQVPCGEEPAPIIEIEKADEISDEIIVEKADSIQQNYYYRIQVSASKSKQGKSDFEKYLMGKDQVFEEQHQGLFKYSIGTFSSSQEGQNRVKQYLSQRNLQGFLVGYINHVRTDLDKMPDYRK